MEHLVTNSGIQFITSEIEINLSDQPMIGDRPLRYTFIEYKDPLTGDATGIDLLCNHNGIYITMDDVRRDGMYAVDANGIEILNILGENVPSPALNALTFTTYKTGDKGVFSINTLAGYMVQDPNNQGNRVSAFSLLLDKWLPVPMFEKGDFGYTQDFPSAWCRVKIEKIGAGRTPDSERLRLIWAFDTETASDPLSDMRPVFYDGEASKEYLLCNCIYQMFNFLYPSEENAPFAEYIDALLGKSGNTTFRHIAYYIYLINYLRLSGASPEVTLHHDDNGLGEVPVDLVLDIGNSRTCGVLFENGKFTEAQMLKLRDLTHPDRLYDKSFDMRFVFRQADFGNDIVLRDEQDLFKWFSFVRVGEEATHLVYRSMEQAGMANLASSYSSPKRYLWDLKPFFGKWENLIREDDSFTVQQIRNIYIPRLSEMFDMDGRYVHDGDFMEIQTFDADCRFSRSSLMTIVLIEILMQAISQINSVEYRTLRGNINQRRIIRKIILTCPTAMSKKEQCRLRQCAEEAYDALRRCIPALKNVEVIPSSTAENMWSYDEATCCQLTYLYAEVAKRYQGSMHKFFELKGHVRPDERDTGYNGNSLTVASVDIGAGTTDVMVCSYQCQGEDTNTCITPKPLYWDSFYLAGDDILCNIIKDVILEGPDLHEQNMGNIRSALKASIMAKSVDEISSIPEIAVNSEYLGMVNNIRSAADAEVSNSLKETLVNNLMLDFFGEDTARMSYKARRCRLDFNTQISIPIAQFFMDNLRRRIPSRVYTFNEIFSDNRPAGYLLDYFAYHFGMRFENLVWRFSPEDVAKVVKATMEPLLKQLAMVLYAQHCDIVILAGRPTSLDVITELFVKYVPTSPHKLVRLNDYRVGSWFPTTTGEGYFYDQKSIVAVGAMVGNLATTTGLQGFAIDFSKMSTEMKSTADYIGVYDPGTKQVNNSILAPTRNFTTLDIPVFPVFLGCKQLDSPVYHARPLYALYSNEGRLKVTLSRDYQVDKETVNIDDIQDMQGNARPTDAVELVQQSLVEDGGFWQDKGAFTLTIK